MVGSDITDDELRELDEAGVRGVRFNFLKRLVDATPREVFMEIAERVVKIGWHCVVYFESQDLEDLQPFLTSLPGTIVVDHMGRMIDGLNSGMMTGDPAELNRLTGGQRTLGQFVTDHKAAFGG